MLAPKVAMTLDSTAEHAEDWSGHETLAPSAFGLRRCFADRGDESLDFQTVYIGPASRSVAASSVGD